MKYFWKPGLAGFARRQSKIACRCDKVENFAEHGTRGGYLMKKKEQKATGGYQDSNLGLLTQLQPTK
ncbi:MAG: hypothetical protein P4L41_15570 [Flavipsychrobacter sp.]|nr:hypothetical protein [Flavipsychrobacter sp.]